MNFHLDKEKYLPLSPLHYNTFFYGKLIRFQLIVYSYLPYGGTHNKWESIILELSVFFRIKVQKRRKKPWWISTCETINSPLRWSSVRCILCPLSVSFRHAFYVAVRLLRSLCFVLCPMTFRCVEYIFVYVTDARCYFSPFLLFWFLLLLLLVFLFLLVFVIQYACKTRQISLKEQ